MVTLPRFVTLNRQAKTYEKYLLVGVKQIYQIHIRNVFYLKILFYAIQLSYYVYIIFINIILKCDDIYI